MLYVGWVFNWSQPDFKGFRRVIRFPPSTNLRLLGLSNIWNEMKWVQKCHELPKYLFQPVTPPFISNLGEFFSKLHKQHNYETLHKNLDSRSTERERLKKNQSITYPFNFIRPSNFHILNALFSSNRMIGWWFASPGIVQFKGKFKWSPRSSVRLLYIMLAFFVAFLVKLLPYSYEPWNFKITLKRYQCCNTTKTNFQSLKISRTT